MESTMDQNSVESRSGDAMSIFAQSINVRRPVRSRRRATKKILSPEMEQQAKPGTDQRRHQRRAVVERERARAEFELSRATTMAKELERQIDQANTKASSHRSELQGTHQALQSDTVYVEVMQELDRVKSELHKLQREVKSAREAMAMDERDAETPTPEVTRPDSRVPDGGKPDAGETNEERFVAEVAEAGGLGKGVRLRQVVTRRRANKGIIRSDTSRASSSDTEEFATASSSDVDNDESAQTITQHKEQDGASLHDAEAELNSARIELGSMKEEGLRFASSIERTRKETARVAEEISRLKEQEMKASAQVQQLNAKLLRARSRLEAATGADGQAEAMLAELSAAVRQLDEEIEAAEKERSLTELESQCVREEADNVGAEISAAEQRIRQSVKELEAARAREAAATSKLKAAVDDSAMLARAAAVTPQRSGGNVTISRFEYEYLTGRAEVVRAAAEKKVAAAEAWAEALRAGEKEVALRAEAIEKEIGQATAAAAAEAKSAAPRDQRGALATSGRTRTPPSFNNVKQRKARVQLFMKVIAGKRNGRHS